MKNETKKNIEKKVIITYIIIFTLSPISLILILLELIFVNSIYTLIGKISLTIFISVLIYLAIFFIFLLYDIEYWKSKGKIGYYVMFGDFYLIFLMIFVIIFEWIEFDLRILFAILLISFTLLMSSIIIYFMIEVYREYIIDR